MSWRTTVERVGSILRSHDGPLTRELVRRPGRFGLGQVPERTAPEAVARTVCGFCSTGCGLRGHLRDGQAVTLTFVPQLIPTTRGILTSVHCRPAKKLDAAEVQATLEEAWGDERFVRVLPAGETPKLQSVRGTNFCDVAAVLDARNDTLVLLAALDNLVKGASGQALQCANLMTGQPENTGLLGGAALP